MSCFCKIMLVSGERGWALPRAHPSLSPYASERSCLLCGRQEPGALGVDMLGHTGTSPNLSGHNFQLCQPPCLPSLPSSLW